jgi:hypothetical protein
VRPAHRHRLPRQGGRPVRHHLRMPWSTVGYEPAA